MTMKKGSTGSLALLAFGVMLLCYDLKYDLDTRSNPGPGVFPLLAGVLLVVLAAIELVRDVRAGGSGGLARGENKAVRAGRRLRLKAQEARVGLMVALVILYLAALSWLGFFVSTFAFVIASSRLMGAREWRKPVLLSAGIGLFCYFLFVEWLKLALPGGYLF